MPAWLSNGYFVLAGVQQFQPSPGIGYAQAR
jgi:hypothetical protein